MPVSFFVNGAPVDVDVAPATPLLDRLRASREYRLATIPVIVENALSSAIQRCIW